MHFKYLSKYKSLYFVNRNVCNKKLIIAVIVVILQIPSYDAISVIDTAAHNGQLTSHSCLLLSHWWYLSYRHWRKLIVTPSQWR